MSILTPQRRKSITELWRVQGQSVATTVLATVKDINPLTQPFIAVTVRADTTSPFDIVVSFSPGNAPAGFPSLSSTPPPITITDLVSDGLRAQTAWIPARSNRVIVYVKNNDTVTHTYDVIIHGIG